MCVRVYVHIWSSKVNSLVGVESWLSWRHAGVDGAGDAMRVAVQPCRLSVFFLPLQGQILVCFSL